MGKTLADGYLEIRPDVSKLGPDLRAGIKRINLDRQAREAGKKAGDGFASGFADRSSTFAKVAATTAARITLMGSAAAAAAPGVIQLTAALAPAAGAAAALPAALLAIKAVTGTVKVAVMGVGEAIETGFTGTAEEAREALAKLPPEARRFAASIVGMRGQLKGLQAQVANRFFLPFNDDVAALTAKWLPMLQGRLPNIAGSLGGLAEQFATTATKGRLLAGVNAVLRETDIGLIRARAAVGPLTNALGVLLKVGAPVVRQLGEGFGQAGQQVGVFLQRAAKTGQLQQWLQGGINTLRDLGGILVNVGSILRSVFASATASGNNLLANLRQLTGQAAVFLRSGEGADALASVFQTLSTLGQALRTSLGAVLPAIAQSIRALAPAVQGLAPAFAQLVVAVAPLLPYFTQIAATVLRALVPAVSALAGWLNRNQDVMKALAVTVGGVVLAIKAYELYTKAAAVATAVWSAAQKAAAVAAKVWTGVQWLLNAALTANPIGIVVVAIGALVAAIVLAYQKNETFRKIVQAVWAGVKTAIKVVGDWFVGTLWPSLKRAYEQLAAGFTWLKDRVVAAWNLLKAGIQLHWAVVRGVFNIIRTFVTQTIPNAFSAGVNLVLSFWRRWRDGVSAIWTWVRTNVLDRIRTAITQTIPNAFKAGVSAITTAWQRVQEAARKPVAFVVNQVLNPLISGFNNVGKIFGVPRVNPIGGFAEGGQIPGPASGKDNRWAWLRDSAGRVLGTAGLATGEFVVNARDTAKALPLLRWINDGMKGGATKAARYIGRPLTDRPGDGSEGWAFAKGGLVGFLKDVWGAVSNPGKLIKAPVEAALSRIPGSGLIQNFLLGMGRKLVGGLTNWLTGNTGGTAGGAIGKAQAFVRAQHGKPYIWAAAGPQGYDCSGIVSAVWNILKGRAPHRHTFSTGMLPGSFFPKPGRGGPLTAGWAHPGQRGASANVGHMAGELLGLPFESRGSTGVLVGPRARRVSAFAHVGHFDSGGWLPPGLSLAYNGTGRPEPVTPAPTMDAVVDRLNALIAAVERVAPGVGAALQSNTARAAVLARGMGVAPGRR